MATTSVLQMLLFLKSISSTPLNVSLRNFNLGPVHTSNNGETTLSNATKSNVAGVERALGVPIFLVVTAAAA